MGTNRPIEGINPLKPAPHYTYKDYLQWPPEERWEVIQGVAYAMSPSPNRKHQGVLRELSRQIGVFLQGKSCKLFIAPFDVLFMEPGESIEDTGTIVQPDLLVLCDTSKLTDVGVVGAPDFIIEIQSPSTAFRDQVEKKLLYEKHGVKEYWVVNPETLEAFVYRLKNDRYGLPEPADLRNATPVSLFPGLELCVKEEEI